ncbi:hypothetical protein [Marinobacter halophilus]|uniref:Alginate export domain-containing protein n=1 Tax=Marinobacter halophilus TaxID=1323740 RepID=A0A2T1KD84_9GAMM|nr:hypothetical protein [Marinobacter halophilus]PSF08076.1 hypothetical protein C7H08_11825 [Marinobacter halophilus]GGC59571.1 hypothetical protein GCM10011362_04940 [Marinobacter halophilus]
MNASASVLLASLLSLALPAAALDLNGNSEIHGFVNQAYLYSPDNPYGGPTAENGSFKFREVGLNGFVELTPDFRLAGQVLSRRHGSVDDGDARIDFLLADYLVLSNESMAFGIRAGRVKNNIGFYNAVRDIPSARPGYGVPQSVYFDTFRDSLLSINGVNLYGSIFAGDTHISWELSAGEQSVDSESVEYYAFGRRIPQGEADDVPIRLFHIDVRPGFQRNLRLGLSLVDVSIDLKDTQSTAGAQAALIADAMDAGTAMEATLAANPQRYVTGASIDGLFALASAQYSFEKWVLTAEYLNVETDFDVQLAGLDTSNTNTTEAYYLQIEWLPTPLVTALVRYEELYLKRDDRSGGESAIDYSPYRGFGKGWTLGGKWMFADHWTLIGQASFNEGTAWLPNYNGIENENIEKYWDYYVLSLNFQF